MKYLVTGGLGVVGSAFVRAVVAEGHRARVLDSAEEPRNRWIAEQLCQLPGVEIVARRLETVREHELFADCDAIVHAAAHTGIPDSAADPLADWTSNVDATLALLEVLRSNELRIPTVVMSSVKPYDVGNVPASRVGDRYVSALEVAEDYPLAPDEPYAASKIVNPRPWFPFAIRLRQSPEDNMRVWHEKRAAGYPRVNTWCLATARKLALGLPL